MQAGKEQPLILTIRLDEESQAFFNRQRKQYFPPERNYLDAHLILFHQLPDEPSTIEILQAIQQPAFTISVSGLMNLGAGVAYRMESIELIKLHRELSQSFAAVLIPQDKQGFRPHITIQNKTTPALAKALFFELNVGFKPFEITAIGSDLWTYLDGPWRHEQHYPFAAI